MTITHNPKNYLEKITEVYCFVSSDDDGEGIIGETVEIDGHTVLMPFVCADKARLESIKPLAKRIARQKGIKIKLIKLSRREVIEVIK